MTQSANRSSQVSERRQYPSNKLPIRSIILILLGDVVYLGWGVGLFIGFAVTGVFTLLATVLFISTVGNIVIIVLMAARPMMHRLWGLLVIIFTTVAIAVGGPALVDSFAYNVAIVGPGGYLGLIWWSIPIALVLVGGGVAIVWEPSES